MSVLLLHLSNIISQSRHNSSTPITHPTKPFETPPSNSMSKALFNKLFIYTHNSTGEGKTAFLQSACPSKW